MRILFIILGLLAISCSEQERKKADVKINCDDLISTVKKELYSLHKQDKVSKDKLIQIISKSSSRTKERKKLLSTVDSIFEKSCAELLIYEKNSEGYGFSIYAECAKFKNCIYLKYLTEEEIIIEDTGCRFSEISNKHELDNGEDKHISFVGLKYILSLKDGECKYSLYKIVI